MAEIVVVGGGGHAKVLIAVLKKLDWTVLGYTDQRNLGLILGSRCLGDDAALGPILGEHEGCAAVIGVGKVDASSLRRRLHRQVLGLGFETPVVVSPSAVVNDEVVLGAGSVVIDGAVINSGARLGDLCIANSHSTVEHDCILGENVHIAPGAVLSGCAQIGDDCMVGAGATVIQGVKVCTGCVIGAGAVVIADIAEAGVYVGNPARRIA